MGNKVSIPFKRESVSKDTDTGGRGDGCTNQRVSIPFKRESVSKAEYGQRVVLPSQFQFPSNGKAYPKSPVACLCAGLMIACFNSLQTGKRIQSTSSSWPQTASSIVSIPFKRESVSKARLSSAIAGHLCDCFNSLQTGKRIQRS